MFCDVKKNKDICLTFYTLWVIVVEYKRDLTLWLICMKYAQRHQKYPNFLPNTRYKENKLEFLGGKSVSKNSL